MAWMSDDGSARIENDRGKRGMASLAVTRHDGALVLLSAYHLLFPKPVGREAVWVRDDARRRRVALALHGKLGRFGQHYVDCAVAAIHEDRKPISAKEIDGLETVEVGQPAAETIVTKAGARSDADRGRIVSVDAREDAVIDGRRRPAMNQIIVRSTTLGIPFSGPGDSGALLRDDGDRIVGLLWGRNPRGDSVACPIRPVLDVLGIHLARVVTRRS